MINFKWILCLFLVGGLTSVSYAEKDSESILIAQSSRKNKKRRRSANELRQVKELALSGNYKEASVALFKISRSSRYKKELPQIKYMLGLMLMELNLSQSASFVFYDVIDEVLKTGNGRRYLKQSLGKLSQLSNKLNSDVLLKYAVSRIQIKDFPKESKDLFFYRLGELRYREGRFGDSAKAFSRVSTSSSVFPQALYKQGLAYTERNQLRKARTAFDELLALYKQGPVNHPNRANALLALGRIHYQAKKWSKAIDFYRLVPRDTPQWHNAMFEMSWAMFRSGRFFRSALSNFHTLHSPYYESNYKPESLLLRGMIYLYICRYDEMEKVMGLFDRIYKPVEASISQLLSRSKSTGLYWDEIQRGMMNRKVASKKKVNLRLKEIVISSLLEQSPINDNIKYHEMLLLEKQRIEDQGPAWYTSSVGKFSRKIVNRRIKSTETLLGTLTRSHLIRLKSELRDFFEQGDFLKFEMVSGKKEAVGKQIANRNIPKKTILDDSGRDYFIANGFEYWPFQGEYWLDELGNYHYVGVQACK